MMHKFPGTIFSVNILISMKKDAEHISVNTVRTTFLLHKLIVLSYVMSEVAAPSFLSYSCSEHFRNTGERVLILVMTACGNYLW